MSDKRVAVVTGANRGIGYEIARQLLERDFAVYLACRSPDAAATAARSLGSGARAVTLDAADPQSAGRAADLVSAEVGRVDVLVNNAGVLDPGDESALTVEPAVIEQTLRTNAIGPWVVVRAFLPLLSQAASPRVVNVSSGGGSLAEMGHWAPAYSVSKAALNAVTRQLAAALRGRVAVNAVCPGWVKTDMGGAEAPRTAAEGADTPVWLATDAPWTLTGRFFRDRREIPW